MPGVGQLQTQHFLRALRRYGRVPVQWLRYLGPCPNSHNDPYRGFAMDLTCALCGGTGRLYQEMDLPTGAPSGGRLHSFNQVRREVREPVPGVAARLYLSYLPDEYSLGAGDRLILDLREYEARELLKRGAGEGDYLRYPVATLVRAVYGRAGELTAGYALNGTGTQILWDGGPTVGHGYTLAYAFRPTYEVAADGQSQRNPLPDGSRFPSRVTLNLWQQTDVDTEADTVLPAGNL